MVLRSRRGRGFKKRQPRLKLLPGSSKKGGKDGIDFDGHEALPGETGFNARVFMKEESTYVRNGIEDGYEGEADETQLDWEEDETYDPKEAEGKETKEEVSDEVSEEVSDEESEAGDWTDEESDDYSVYSE